MYVRASYTPTEMHTGHVACCPLVSRVECVLHIVLRLEKDGTDRRTDRPMYDAYP